MLLSLQFVFAAAVVVVAALAPAVAASAVVGVLLSLFLPDSPPVAFGTPAVMSYCIYPVLTLGFLLG